MRVELIIDLSEELPKDALPALEKNLSKRLQNQFDECSLGIHRAGLVEICINGGEKNVKKG